MFSDIRVQTGGPSFRTAGKDGQPAVTAGARGRGIPEGGFVHCFQLLVLPGRRKQGSGDRQAERLVRRSSAPGPQRKRPGRSAPLRTLMLRPRFVSLLDAACQDEAAGTLRTHSFAPRVPSGGWSCPVLSARSKREEKKNCCVQPQGDHTLETVLKKITLKRHFQDEADPSSTPGTGYRGTSAYPVTQAHPHWALGMGEQGPWVQPTLGRATHSSQACLPVCENGGVRRAELLLLGAGAQQGSTHLPERAARRLLPPHP